MSCTIVETLLARNKVCAAVPERSPTRDISSERRYTAPQSSGLPLFHSVTPLEIVPVTSDTSRHMKRRGASFQAFSSENAKEGTGVFVPPVDASIRRILKLKGPS